MTAISYSADDIALLVIDAYNDFMSEGGKLYERTKETAEVVGFYVGECRNRRLYLFRTLTRGVKTQSMT